MEVVEGRREEEEGGEGETLVVVENVLHVSTTHLDI